MKLGQFAQINYNIDLFSEAPISVIVAPAGEIVMYVQSSISKSAPFICYFPQSGKFGRLNGHEFTVLEDLDS